MKKIMIAAFAVVMFATSAKAEFVWSTWFRDDIKDREVRGCVLGLAAQVDKGAGAELDVCISKANHFENGAQVAFGYCRNETLRNGVQAALFWNESDHAALQLGIVCHNRGGFLPWFVFFNFDKTCWGKAK